MHIRTFRAANLNAALTQIREQMGPDASVLHTRQVPSGLLGFLGKNKVEVTAGLKHVSTLVPESNDELNDELNDDSRDDSSADASGAQPLLRRHPGHGPLGKGPLTKGPLGKGEIQTLDAWEEAESQLLDEYSEAGVSGTIARYWLAHCRSMLNNSGGSLHSSSLWQPLEDLRQTDRTHPIDVLRRLLQQLFAEKLDKVQPITVTPGARRVVALVGATGVGKTTTIAKLAAQFRLRQQARIGLLTLDSFRAAAVEQIDAFAQAMKMPLQVIRQSSDVAGALAQFADLDLVFVDTVGQSPRGEDRIASLASLLEVIQPHETHLVIDANSSMAAARDNLQAFSSLHPNACILSKTDEVGSIAAAMSAILVTGMPMSYVTTGQMVPDDLTVADNSKLALWLSGLAVNGFASVISSPTKVVNGQ